MNVTPMKQGEGKKAAAVVARAFFDYPSLVAYFPDAEKRKWKLPWYMGRVIRSAEKYGEVMTTDDGAGVLFLLPPGHTRLSDWDYVKCGFLAAPLVVGLKRYGHVNASEAFLANTQEKLLQNRPHYYLWGIAVDPLRQRSGAGKALLQALFDRADREAMPVYLETHQFANVAYYEQRGFRLIHTGAMPGDDLPFWCMLREPREEKA
jgi:GNAT superfamily N-acetyltransferase